jgi:tetratricopeptide (TPR) repeat protein
MTKVLLLVAVLASAAQADVWQRALDRDTIDHHAFEEAIAKGDEAAIAANSRSVSLPQVKRDLDTAIEQYRLAAKANPKSPEPYFRIGMILNSFFFECEEPPAPPTCSGRMNSEKAREIVDAWDTFEKLSPLDPRINELLLKRAILKTKLVAQAPSEKRLLEDAMRDYQTLIERDDGLMNMALDGVIGNLAETYMMLGRLDDAIDSYRDAYRAGGRGSVIYGLAVALDRNDRAEDAMTLIRDLGIAGKDRFQQDLDLGRIFFVPFGEHHYYMALAEEAFGNYDKAIDEWKQFVRSGAHPEYQPRAKQHLDALLAKKNLRWKPPTPRTPQRDE